MDLAQVSKGAIESHITLTKEIRKIGALVSSAAEKKIVSKHASKTPPSVYQVGDELLVQFNKNKNCNKIKGKGVSAPRCYNGKVVERKLKTKKYKVSFEVEGKSTVEWFSVTELSSVTRLEEKMMQCTCMQMRTFK